MEAGVEAPDWKHHLIGGFTYARPEWDIDNIGEQCMGAMSHPALLVVLLPATMVAYGWHAPANSIEHHLQYPVPQVNQDASSFNAYKQPAKGCDGVYSGLGPRPPVRPNRALNETHQIRSTEFFFFSPVRTTKRTAKVPLQWCFVRIHVVS